MRWPPEKAEWIELAGGGPHAHRLLFALSSQGRGQQILSFLTPPIGWTTLRGMLTLFSPFRAVQHAGTGDGPEFPPWDFTGGRFYSDPGALMRYRNTNGAPITGELDYCLLKSPRPWPPLTLFHLTSGCLGGPSIPFCTLRHFWDLVA